jgi:hypothetical protein
MKIAGQLRTGGSFSFRPGASRTRGNGINARAPDLEHYHEPDEGRHPSNNSRDHKSIGQRSDTRRPQFSPTNTCCGIHVIGKNVQLPAHVANRGRQHGDAIASSAQPCADRVIICQAVGDIDDSTYLGEGFAFERNRRSETGFASPSVKPNTTLGRRARRVWPTRQVSRGRDTGR